MTLGTVALWSRTDLLRTAVAAVRDLVTSVVVTTGPNDVASLGPLPDNVFAARYVPQQPVLARVDVVVSHGGAGTTLGALWAGVPHVVLPQGAPSQELCAARVAEIGAGLHLDPAHQTESAIKAAVEQLLTAGDARTVARTVAAGFSLRPTPDDVAEMLEHVDASHDSP